MLWAVLRSCSPVADPCLMHTHMYRVSSRQGYAFQESSAPQAQHRFHLHSFEFGSTAKARGRLRDFSREYPSHALQTYSSGRPALEASAEDRRCLWKHSHPFREKTSSVRSWEAGHTEDEESPSCLGIRPLLPLLGAGTAVPTEVP